MPENKRICRTCHLELPISEFGKNINFRDGIEINCKKCINKRNRASYHKFGDKRRAETKIWQKNNSGWRRDYVNNKYKEMKDIVFQAYGGKCVMCGFSDRRALCIDHINGNGIKERKASTPAGFLRKLIRENFPKDYQVLCANCNQIKAIKNREIPVSKIYLES